jgi:hypothetical protein
VLWAEPFAQHVIRVSDRTVAKLLRGHGYSPQARAGRRGSAALGPQRSVRAYQRQGPGLRRAWRAGDLRRLEEEGGRNYPIGKKVSVKELPELRIDRHDFHGDWNYVNDVIYSCRNVLPHLGMLPLESRLRSRIQRGQLLVEGPRPQWHLGLEKISRSASACRHCLTCLWSMRS